MNSSKHVWCKWHVLKKMREKVGSMYMNGTSFRNDFNILINEMMTVEEFEKEWQEIMTHYGLEKNSFLHQVYDCRFKWAKPYLKGDFCAKMCSTQRSECMNNLLKCYVSRSAPINIFFQQYTKMFADRCEEEDFEIAHSKKDGKIIRSNFLIERHAAKIYTRGVFKLFLLELYQSGPFIIKGNQVDGRITLEHADAEQRQRWCKVVYDVIVDRESDTFKCECGMFEHSGLLCRHVLKVMVHIGVRQIPARYIMKRWTKDARGNMPDHLKCYQTDARVQMSKTFRHNIMYVKALEIIKLADRGVVTFQHAIMAFDKTKNDLEKIIVAEITKEQASNDQGNAAEPGKEPTQETTQRFKENQTTPTDSQQTGEGLQNGMGNMFSQGSQSCLPPEKRSAKGRPKTKRFKSAAEGASNKSTRKCAICGSRDHFTRSCPCHLVGAVTSSDSEEEDALPVYHRTEDHVNKDAVQETELNQQSQVGEQIRITEINKTPQSAQRRCKKCGLPGHYTPKCPKFDGPKKAPKEVTCKKCGLGGHYSSTCGGESSYKRKR
ncbi:hypothetical protein ACQJBY_008201 [Aegilops geniculata]